MMKTILGFTALAALGIAQASADGSMKVGGKTAKLTHVYAYAVEGFFDKKSDDTVVLLTDKELTPVQARDTFTLRKMSEEGKLAFVQETINAKGQIVNFTLGHAEFKFPPGGGSTEHVFEGKLAKGSVAGKVFTKGEQKTFGVTYEYSVTLNAPVAARK